MKRATTQVGRYTDPKVEDPVLAFGIYKVKGRLKQSWELVPQAAQGPKSDREEASDLKIAQTMVCIALEDLGPHNGFPFELQQGMDVCIYANETLLLLPTGSGFAILVWLAL
ncbi:hypothetical protein CERZMDRAFT_98055 [Cercospora zeae-maydis SCOH1-5]|uniref:Uncharacterized protein n=1 Tax=Cercospora zeae-maydis SCOH1-5 TaxID=717836 RepID=A0A6A6FFE2_9PEZI|nr:hypothetical protein CERZMDRAFT_98055 [Cercospora zeae-maydis SCOH1-5]